MWEMLASLLAHMIGDRDFSSTGFTLANEPLAPILQAQPSLLRFIK
jgi:hypothetical protein